MKKLHSLAFYALVAPAMTLGAGSVLAEQSNEKDIDCEQRSSQHDQDGKKIGALVAGDEQHTQRAGQSDTKSASDRQSTSDQSRMQNRGYLSSVPANAMQGSDLIGAEIKTTGDKDVGPVSDLVIDENGRVVAVVVGVGGFLGMGNRDVAIGWDDVTRSGASDDLELQIDLTRDDLRSAPEFKKED